MGSSAIKYALIGLVIMICAGFARAQTYTFECVSSSAMYADSCEGCGVWQIQSRSFDGLVIYEDGDYWRWIEIPYTLKVRGDTIDIWEHTSPPSRIAKNYFFPDRVSIRLGQTTFATMQEFLDSTWCNRPANGADTSAIFYASDSISVGPIQRGDTLTITAVQPAYVVFDPLLNKYVISIDTAGLGGGGGSQTLEYLDNGGDDVDVFLSPGGSGFKLIGQGGVNIYEDMAGVIAISYPGQTLDNTSNSTSHTLTLLTGAGSLKLSEGTGIGIATTGTSLDGIVTITNTGDLSNTNELDSKWTDAGAFTYLTATGDRGLVGASSELNSAYRWQVKDGLYVQGAGSTNATNSAEFHNSSGGNTLILQDDGDVGINTTNPTSKLHVVSGGSGTGGTVGAFFTGTFTGASGTIRGVSNDFTYNPSSNQSGIFQAVANLIRVNGGNTKDLVQSQNNTVDISGTGAIDNLYTIRNDISSNNGGSIAAQYGMLNTMFNTNAQANGSHYGVYNDMGGNAVSMYGMFTSIATTGGFTPTNSYGLYISTINASTNRFAIYSTDSNAKTYLNGSTGIGTNAPSEKLHVSGNIRVTGGYFDSSNSDGNAGDVLTSAGTTTAWAAPAAGGSVTAFNNGLTLTGTTVQWGGALVQNTTIDGNTFYDLHKDGRHVFQRYESNPVSGANVTAAFDISGIAASPLVVATPAEDAVLNVRSYDNGASTYNQNMLSVGNYATAALGSWVKTRDEDAYNTYYPINFNPNGGKIGFGRNPASNALDAYVTMDAGTLTGSAVSGSVLHIEESEGNAKAVMSFGVGTDVLDGEVGYFDGANATRLTNRNTANSSSVRIAVGGETTDRVIVTPAGMGVGSTVTTNILSTLQVEGSVGLQISTPGGDLTFTAAHCVVIKTGGGAPVTYTIPDPDLVGGRYYWIMNHTSQTITLSRNVTKATGASTFNTVLAGETAMIIAAPGNGWRGFKQTSL